MREKFRLLLHVLRMKDDKLPRIILFGQQPRAKLKTGRPRMGWEDVVRTYLREIVTSWLGVQREAMNKPG